MSEIVPQNTPYQQCITCQKLLPATTEYFNANKNYRHGVRTQCKECRNAMRRKPKVNDVPEGYKRCTTCKEIKPHTVEFFYASSGYLDAKCKTCVKNRENAKYRAKNPIVRKSGAQTPEQRAKLSESLRNSEKLKVAAKENGQKKRGKPLVFSNPELHSANMSKAFKGKLGNRKRKKHVTFTYKQQEMGFLHLDLPVFDGCEPRDNTEIDKVMGVYAIVNTVTGKMYIGSATDIKHRWYLHRRDLFKSRHHSEHLQRAWNKYGSDVFNFRLLEIIEDTSILISQEQYWLDRYHTHDKQHGYNISPTAGSPMGVRHTDEARAHMKASKQGFTISPEIRAMGYEKRLQAIRKITENDAINIITRLELGELPSIIAQDYPISISNVLAIRDRKSWKHLPRNY